MFVKLLCAACMAVAPIFLGYYIIMDAYVLEVAMGHLRTFGLVHTLVYFALFYLTLSR